MTPDKMCHQIALPVLEEVYPRDLVCQVLQELDRWEQRERKLNHVLMVYLLIAWTMLPTMALKRVWSQLTSALRWLSQQAPSQGLPGASALCYRRRMLGVGPLRLLMRLACKPLCEPSASWEPLSHGLRNEITSSKEGRKRAITLWSPFLGIQRAISRTTQSPIRLRGKSGAGKAMSKGRPCEFRRSIHHLWRWLPDGGRLARLSRLDGQGLGKFGSSSSEIPEHVRLSQSPGSS